MIRTNNTSQHSKNGRQLSNGDQFLERDIAIGMITQDEICELCKQQFDTFLLQSRTARKLATWCLEYYKKYNKAPGSTIKQIYFQKLKEGELSEDEAEEWEEDLLPGLSGEYEDNGINVEHLKDRILSYRKERLREQAGEAIKSGDEERGRKLLDEINATDANDLIVRDIDDYEGLERPKPLLRPWLREGEYTLVYADKGVGKSMFGVLIAHLLACQNYDEPVCEIDPKDDSVWQVEKPVRTLFIAGEMAYEIQERFGQFRWTGAYAEDKKPKIIDRAEQQAKTEKDFSLSKRTNQRRIIEYLKRNHEFKLIVLDNVQTLFDLEDSNHASEWNTKVNPFLQDLEHLGVACLILDHTGKDASRGAMGTHAKITRASNVIHLKNHKNKQPGQAWFKVEPMYQRHTKGVFKPFYLKFFRVQDDTEWEATDKHAASRSTQIDDTKRIILWGLDEGWMLKEIAEKAETTPQNINEHKKTMRRRGLITGEDSITDYGETFLDEMGTEQDSLV